MDPFYETRRLGYRQLYFEGQRRSLTWTNGFQRIPTRLYSALLPCFHKSGRMVDLGCGNGLLLRFLVNHSFHVLEPFGVDFLPEAIHEAQTLVHPDRPGNFVVKNIVEWRPDGLFDFIMFDPYQVRQTDLHAFFEHCTSNLAPDGRTIVYCYADALAALSLCKISEFPGMEHTPLIELDCPSGIQVAFAGLSRT